MNDKIIEVAAVLFENGEITQSYTSLVNPDVFVPYSATAINHITNEMVQNAPNEKIVFAELVDFLGDALKQQTSICAHNASFDMNFLSETLMRLGYDGKISYVDTLSLSRSLIKGLHCNGVQREHNKNLIMDCQSYTKYRPNETTGGIFVSWRRKEELPTGA